MRQVRIGDITIDAVIEREGPWRRPQDFFPAYDEAIFKRHLPTMEPEVFDQALGMMVITYQTFVVRTPRYTILVDTCTGEDKGHPPPFDFPGKERWRNELFALGIAYDQIDYASSIAEPSHGSRFLQHVENSGPPAATVLVSNEAKQEEPDTDILALMSGKCSTLRVAGRDFACRAVAFFHGEQGRANFTIALDDPADDSQIITFSGQNSRREQDNLYELQIDRMLLNSKHRPKVDGLPVPIVDYRPGYASSSEASRPDRFPASPAARPMEMAKSMSCSSNPMVRQ